MKKKYVDWRRTAFAVFALCLSLEHPLKAADPGVLPASKTPSVMEVSEPAGAVPKDPSPAYDPTAPALKIERTTEGTYYLDFKAAALINVLNVLSNLSGINFVAGKEVSDRQVSMTLDNVSLEDALQAIAYGSNVNYDFLPGRNIYLFRASADSPEKPPLLTRVFKLYYVRVTKLKEITASSSSGGSSSGDSSSSSSGGSSGGSSSGGGLQTLAQQDDTVNLENSAIYKAVNKILSERGKVSVDERSNSLVVTDSEDRLKMIEFAIAQLDRPLDQVLINVILVETFEDLDHELGIEWGDTDGAFGTVTGSVSDTAWPLRPGAMPNRSSNLSSIFRGFGNAARDAVKQLSPTNTSGAITTQGIRDFSSFQITVKALESASKLKVLAKPKILALDNQPALIKIATNAAIGTLTVTESGGAGTSSQSIERSEIGTILRVTPLINTGGRITLTLEPTFATVDQSAITVSANAGATGDPTSRTARTTLMVNDGQTIAMGGMLFSNQSNGNRKVPFFGNIPVIGKAFFTSNSKIITDRELILFVTPYIISDPSMLQTPDIPGQRLRYDDEIAPFWKVKQKQWYKEMKDGKKEGTDFESYFNVRRKLIDSTLGTLDQNAKAASQGAK